MIRGEPMAKRWGKKRVRKEVVKKEPVGLAFGRRVDAWMKKEIAAGNVVYMERAGDTVVVIMWDGKKYLISLGAK
ncbi:hypothetical protein ES703_117701 [subsurface metagenome]